MDEPNPYIVSKLLKKGLPLWNQREGLGTPLLANPNYEVLNPLKLALNLFPSPYLQDLFYLARIFLMGLFTFLFLRELGLEFPFALFGGTVFMLSGYSLLWINLHPLSTACYVPGLFYFFERTLKAKSRYDHLLFSLLLSFAIFAGKLPVLVMGITLLFGFSVVRTYSADYKKWLKRNLLLIRDLIWGILMAAVLLLPFFELMNQASPIAGPVTTGASCHILSFQGFISLWQPFLLGTDYLNHPVLKGLQDVYPGIMPYVGLNCLFLSFYAVLSTKGRKIWWFFYIWCLFFLAKIYGLLPQDILYQIPVYHKVNFLKYYGTFYFSLSIVAAFGLNQLIKGPSRSRIILSSLLTAIILIACFSQIVYGGYLRGGEDLSYIRNIFIVSITALSVYTCLLLPAVKGKSSFKILIPVSISLFELFIYMPHKHPERTASYSDVNLKGFLSDSKEYRILGDDSSLPPLVSNAMDLYDLRAVSVLTPNNYYQFFQNRIGFSVPHTNNPDLLVASLSPFIDITNVKYILSRNLLGFNKEIFEKHLRENLENHRWIDFFSEMIWHKFRGNLRYGYYDLRGQRRFSLFFSGDFNFTCLLNNKYPYFFIGAGIPVNGCKKEKKLYIIVKGPKNRHSLNIAVQPGQWNDYYIDLREFIGQKITLTISGKTDDSIVLGASGPSIGEKEEIRLIESTPPLFWNEKECINFIGYKNGFYIYENSDVLPRVFFLKGNHTSSVRSAKEPFEYPDRKKAEVACQHLSNNSMQLEVNCPDNGILVFSSLYYPGWKAYVDKKETKIEPYLKTLTAIEVPKGEHLIELVYQPLSFYTGCLISLLSFCTLVFFQVIRKKPEKNI